MKSGDVVGSFVIYFKVIEVDPLHTVLRSLRRKDEYLKQSSYIYSKQSGTQSWALTTTLATI